MSVFVSKVFVALSSAVVESMFNPSGCLTVSMLKSCFLLMTTFLVRCSPSGLGHLYKPCLVGATLPPHLSPFVEEREGDYIPPERQTGTAQYDGCHLLL